MEVYFLRLKNQNGTFLENDEKKYVRDIYRKSDCRKFFNGLYSFLAFYHILEKQK